MQVAIATALHQRVSGNNMLRTLAIGYDVSLSVFNAPLDASTNAYGVASTCFAIRVAGFIAPKSGADDFETNNLTIAQQAAMSDGKLIKKLMTYSKGLDFDMAKLVDNIINIDKFLIVNDMFS